MSGFWKISGTAVLLLGSMTGCVELKENAMYLEDPNPEPEAFHTSDEIFSDYMTSEFWISREGGCIEVESGKEFAKEGTSGLNLKWTKVSGGCDWVGFGFGWDNWSGKDLTSIYSTGAIQFYVRLKEGTRTTLPWALGIEDFSGAQAWLGMSSNAVQGDEISTEWTKIQLPLSEFNWDEQGADPSNIKQLIIEVQGDGELEIDEVSLAPYEGGYRKRAVLSVVENNVQYDGRLIEDVWRTDGLEVEDSRLYLAATDGALLMAGRVVDETPLMNNQEGKEIYNGDAIEIAFSTDEGSYTRRTMYRSTDKHFAIRMSDQPQVYDYRQKKVVEDAVVAVNKTEQGYSFEAFIPVSNLNDEILNEGQLLGLELAIDLGNGNHREVQQRWNNPETAGFHELPSLWGEMIVKTNRDE